MADRTLVVKLVGDEADLLRSYTRAGRATKKFGDDTDKGLSKADKRLRSFKSAGKGFAGGLIAGELIRGLDTFIDKAAESEAVLTQVRQGLRNTGQSWDKYGDQINKTVEAQARLGFDDESLLASFDKFQRQVGDVNQALRLNNIALDVARGRNISLEAATTLVTKAQAGQRGALTRLGIEVDKSATKVDLLRTLTEKYGGSAEAAADDARTAQERLNVQLENVQERIGEKLLPVVGELADGLEDGLVAADRLAGALKTIGNTKIPVLNIPINFEFPGTNSKVADLLFKTNIFEVAGFAIDVFRQGPNGPLVSRGDATQGGPQSIARVQRGPGGAPIVVENKIELDGEPVARNTTKQQQKQRRRNPRAKSGPNSAFR